MLWRYYSQRSVVRAADGGERYWLRAADHRSSLKKYRGASISCAGGFRLRENRNCLARVPRLTDAKDMTVGITRSLQDSRSVIRLVTFSPNAPDLNALIRKGGDQLAHAARRFDVPQEHNASGTAGECLVEDVIEAAVDVSKQ